MTFRDVRPIMSFMSLSERKQSIGNFARKNALDVTLLSAAAIGTVTGVGVMLHSRTSVHDSRGAEIASNIDTIRKADSLKAQAQKDFPDNGETELHNGEIAILQADPHYLNYLSQKSSGNKENDLGGAIAMISVVALTAGSFKTVFDLDNFEWQKKWGFPEDA